MAYYDGKLNFDTSIDDSGMKSGLSKLSALAKNSAVAIGAGIAAGLGAATKAGMDFEAQMSKVAAISGASAGDMQLLTDKAKQMGIDTAFSASQAGEALQYMAMAGWKTEDMLGGIEGVMNLAAASGEDLGRVSDIVTDALTAFGLQAKDSAHFADVLAVASSNSNTNVGLMGATFKYVAPIAGTMKFSIEDTAQAIGLMANASIKGEQAGTALRGILTRLAKPPKEAAEAMQALSLSVTNSGGSFKSFGTILTDMRSKFSKLTDEQKTQYAAMLAGQEAMSGLLAIVNAAPADFDKLSNAIKNADGASKEMADTMLDNLKGQLTLLGSSMEGLGLAIYDGIGEPMKEAAKSAIASVNGITASIRGGELKSAIASVGQLFGSLVNTLASFAASALPVVVNLLSALANNLNIIVPVISAATAGIIAYKVAVTAAAAKQALFNAVMNLNPIGVVIGLVAGLAAGYAALCNSCFWLTEEEKKQHEEMKKLADESATLATSQTELMNAQNERVQSIRDNAAAELAQIDYAQQLYDKLTGLADETGRVDEKNRGLASFILGELNSALGTQYTMTGNQINQYSDMQSSIQGLIEKEQARIALAAYSDILTEALKTESEAKRKAKEASDNLVTAEANVGNLIEEYRTAFYNGTGAMIDYDRAVRELNSNILLLDPGLREIRKRYQEQSKAVEDNRAVIEQSGQAIIKSEEAKMQYQDAAAANAEGNYAKANSAALLSAEQRKTLENSSAAELADALIANSAKIAALEKAKSEARTEAEKAGWEERIKQEEEYGAQLATKMAETGALSTEGIASGLISSEKLEKVKAAIKKVTDLIPDWARKLMDIRSPSRVMRDEVGAQIVAGVAVGIDKNGSLVTDAMERLNTDMLQSELDYTNEKKRIEAERAAEDAARQEKQYKERLSKAKDAAEREEIIEEERLRKKKEADDAYLKRLKEDADRERKIIDDLKKDITKLYDDIASRAERSFSEVEQNREGFVDKLKGYGSLYTEKTDKFIGLGENGGDLVFTDILLDLSGQRKELEEYAALLREVENREGIPRDMFKLLRDMPIEEAVKYADALLGASDEELARYVEDWTAIQRLSEDTGVVLFGEDMKEAADDAARYMKEKLEEAGFEIPEGFFASGSISAEKFGDGFVTGIDKKMGDIRAKLQAIAQEFDSAVSRMNFALVPDMVYGGASGGGSVVNNYNSAITYQLASGGETVHQQLQAIDAQETRNKLRGK